MTFFPSSKRHNNQQGVNMNTDNVIETTATEITEPAMPTLTPEQIRVVEANMAAAEAKRERRQQRNLRLFGK
jgi:hypothetical protein